MTSVNGRARTGTTRPPAWQTDPVVVKQGHTPRVSADCMRALHKATGQTMSDLLQGDDDASRLQATAFMELYRRAAAAGHMPDAGTLWELAGAVELDFEVAGPIDPLGDGSSTTSPRSVDTGG